MSYFCQVSCTLVFVYFWMEYNYLYKPDFFFFWKHVGLAVRWLCCFHHVLSKLACTLSAAVCLPASTNVFCPSVAGAWVLTAYVALGVAECLLTVTCIVSSWPHCTPCFWSETCRCADELESFSAVGRGVLAERLAVRLTWKKVLVTRAVQ